MVRTQFYPVICDSIWAKSLQEKYGIHFTDLLDVQPDGWLNSLEFWRELPANISIIYDCGGWSYRDEDVPPIDSASISKEYERKANHGSMVIAPDHMLIPGVDLDFRRKWNREQAQRFLEDCPDTLKPMAAVHGMSEEERVEHATWLSELGYKHMAIGGVAGRATEAESIIKMVKGVRRSIDPGVWLHVLGLTSLSYYREWMKIGVDSVDGTTYLRQSLAGKFNYINSEGEIKAHAVAQPEDEDSSDFLIHVPSKSRAPDCFCKACVALRDIGLDTRAFGSTAPTHGRAFHNLNVLIKAQSMAFINNHRAVKFELTP